MDKTTTKKATVQTQPAPPSPSFAADRAASGLEARIKELEARLEEKQRRIDVLDSALGEVDVCANRAFDRIRTLVEMQLQQLRIPAGHANLGHQLNVLELIDFAAEDAQIFQHSMVKEAGLVADDDTRHHLYYAAAAAQRTWGRQA